MLGVLCDSQLCPVVRFCCGSPRPQKINIRSVLRAAAVRPVRHSGDIRLAGSDDGTMVSRIHAADIVSVVEASIERPEPGMVMNVADDLPSTRYEVSVTSRFGTCAGR